MKRDEANEVDLLRESLRALLLAWEPSDADIEVKEAIDAAKKALAAYDRYRTAVSN